MAHDHHHIDSEKLVERFSFTTLQRNLVFGLIGLGLVTLMAGLFFAYQTGPRKEAATAAEKSHAAQVDAHATDSHAETTHDSGHESSAVIEAAHEEGGHEAAGGHQREISWLGRLSANFLLNNVYFLTVALGALFFLAIHQIGNAGWHTAIRRVPEAMTMYLPIALVGAVVIFFLMNHLYEWIIIPKGVDALIDAKRAYLNKTGFIVRTFIFFAIWIGGAIMLRRLSLREDIEGGLSFFKRSTTVAAVLTILYAFSFFLYAVDWVKSLEPHWFSTIFGIYMFGGAFLTAMAVLILILYYLKQLGYMQYVNASHFQDVATYMFGFCIFWGYIWVAQYLLIWYSNIPEEGIYYVKRMRSADPEYMGYRGVFYLALFLNFVIPFFGLMTRNARRNPRVFVPIAFVILIGHWVDLFVLIMPGAVERYWHIGLLEVGFFLTMAGIFLYVVFNSLTKGNLVPLKHPYLEESLYHNTGPV